MIKFWGFREHPAKISLDKIKRKLITTTTTEDGKFSSEVGKKQIIIEIFSLYLEDILGPSDDLSNVVIEDDAFDELQAIVNKTMKLKTKKDSLSAERV
jgi:hypothetical protein